ncbi:hypothetical protein RHMOL_Rhmol01G0217000 [Rhododendron molle]|uniref:Uncharacterized protein n=1 Tax=Rhododendron molle TaxID=49168 RepID=A0ACC0Q5X1_RHOML|nr:hypothetical protein RHMOL_Rhmol01G0217000 [Rhododendron molle]
MHPTANFSPASAAPLLFISTSSPRCCDGASSFGDGRFELGNGSRIGVDDADVLRLEVHCERHHSLSLSLYKVGLKDQNRENEGEGHKSQYPIYLTLPASVKYFRVGFKPNLKNWGGL